MLRLLCLLVATLWLSAAAWAQTPGGAGVQGPIPCTAGVAAGFPCDGVHLLAHLPPEALGAGDEILLNDLWGWTDPKTGREYALVGLMNGTAFVDLTDPTRPLYLGTLPSADPTPSIWRDLKVYANHAFIVADRVVDHGIQVFDLRRLRDATGAPRTFGADARYDGFDKAHNIAIDEASGFAYAVGTESCGGGLHIVDIHEPTRPRFAGCFADPTTGLYRTGYTHDAQCVVYRGPDEEYRGRQICIGANETALSIADVTDKVHGIPISTAAYPNVGYVHQGWLTEDHRFFFQDDELDELNRTTNSRTRTLVWDLTDLDDPVLLTTFFGTTGASDHNQYVRDGYVFQANYAAGLRILDATNPAAPVETAFFDTVPAHDDPGFAGAWSSYPYYESGVVTVSSRGEGLFVLYPSTLALAPVRALRARVEGDAVTLSWYARDAQPTAGFDVLQQQTDGTYAPVAFVAAQEPAGAPRRYSIRLESLPAGPHVFRVQLIVPDAGPGPPLEADVDVYVLDQAYALEAPFPNPAREAVHLRLAVAEEQHVTVTLYDLLGRRIADLYAQTLTPNQAHTLDLGLPTLASGPYLLRVEGPTFTASAPVTVVR